MHTYTNLLGKNLLQWLTIFVMLFAEVLVEQMHV
jgi:hypothetical protein